MHDVILHNRKNLGTASLAFYAHDLGIGGMNFLNDLVTGKYGRYVQDDLAAGIRLGVKEAPAFFVNGKKSNQKSPSAIYRTASKQPMRHSQKERRRKIRNHKRESHIYIRQAFGSTTSAGDYNR
ncbi:DsbA family protein [Puia sp. P3]|uniref:DsbA family protein n=1 Tax=Puia sp. P3 TaxID=3423952 RepID=UPI003D6706B4